MFVALVKFACTSACVIGLLTSEETECNQYVKRYVCPTLRLQMPPPALPATQKGRLPFWLLPSTTSIFPFPLVWSERDKNKPLLKFCGSLVTVISPGADIPDKGGD